MRKGLSLKELLIMGGGLFSLHFGAACLLYPVTWGAEAGSAVYRMYAGVFLSGIVLPCMGYLALARGEGNFLDLICRASPKFGRAFIAVLILIMGPLLLVPRVTAALWLGILQLTGLKASSFATVAFNVAVYAAAFFFVSSKGKVLERIGKYLFPVIVAIVAAIIVQCTVSPLAPRVAPSFIGSPVAHGFLAAYAAADLQCALVYGLVVVHSIHNAGIDREYVSVNLVKIGVIGLGLLGLVHLGHMVAGANTGGTINLRLSALYMQMVVEHWGDAGGIAFLFALATATLTATIGLSSSTAGFWEKLLGGRISYLRICAATCVLSCAVSSLGIDTVVDVIGPVLDAFYPATIVITFYYCFVRNKYGSANLLALRCSVIVSTVMALPALVSTYASLFALDLPAFESAYASLPLSSVSMAWVPITAAVYAASLLYGRWRAK